MFDIKKELHNLYVRLEKNNDLINDYYTKIANLHKEIRYHAFFIMNGKPCDLAYHSARIAEYSAQLEEYNTEVEMLKKDNEIIESDIESLESEV